MTVEVYTSDERRVPWPADEAPPAKEDLIQWDNDVWQTATVRWIVYEGRELRCRVTVAPASACFARDG